MPRGVALSQAVIDHAIALRTEQGLTLPEIRTLTGLSKATLSKYLAPYPLSAERKLEGLRKGAATANVTRYDRADKYIHPLPTLEALRDQLGMREREQLNQSLVCAYLDVMGIPYERLDSVTMAVVRPDGAPGMILTRSATITGHRWGHPEVKRGGGVRHEFRHYPCEWLAYVGVLIETGGVYCLPPAIYHQQLLTCRPDDYTAWEQIGLVAPDRAAPGVLARFTKAVHRHAPLVADAFAATPGGIMTLLQPQEAIGVYNPQTNTRLSSRSKSDRLTDTAARLPGALPVVPPQPKLVRRRVPDRPPEARTASALAAALVNAADRARH